MDEKEKERTGASVSRETESVPSGAQHTTPPSKAANRRSAVYIYLVVLFGAAFMMLLLAYFVQQRNNDDAMSDLRNSMTVSRDELMEQIEALEVQLAVMEDQRDRAHKEIDELEARSYEFQTLYDGATDTISHLQYVLNHRTEAMELFYRLDKAYTQGKTQQCRNLIQWMEKPEGGPLKDFLPTRDDRSEYNFGVADGDSPAERYQEIVDALS